MTTNSVTEARIALEREIAAMLAVPEAERDAPDRVRPEPAASRSQTGVATYGATYE